MGQLLVPALVGAGVGAVGGAATGNNPFKTALLGAGLGAGGAGLLGAGSTGATTGIVGTTGEIGSSLATTAGGLGTKAGASSGLGSLLSGIKGVETAPVSFGTGGYVSGIGGQVIPQVASSTIPSVANASTVPFGSTEFISPYTQEGIVNFADGTQSTFAPDYVSSGVNYGANAPDFTPVLGKSVGATGGGYNPSFFGRVGDMIGNPFTDLTARDKLGIGLQGAGMLMQPQQMIQPQVQPIKQGNPEMVSTPLMNVSPNVNPQDKPLTEEELLRLKQLAQYGYRG